ncbi:ABC transporter permease [Flexivirga caeni]|uniref:ABC transporter permease n=1 Tax=Flexivirga caeni TaxID=2294115 RepID=A0A3M9LXM2_9MICO|nr:ABC transporter permease [Flexivirga caeni]RNI18059.1 ABC transporter permease [Flexivirga caeni]
MTVGPGDVNSTLDEVAAAGNEAGSSLRAATGSPGDSGRKKLESRSPVQIAFARLRRDKIAMVCAVIVVLFVLMGIFAPLLAGLEGQSPTATHYDLIGNDNLPSFYTNGQHWLGITSSNGYDVFARFVYGIRPSFLIAISASIVTTVIGVVLGLLAGFLGGWVDRVIGWLTDFSLSLPILLMAIALVPVMSQYLAGSEPSQSQVQQVRIVVLMIVLVFSGWAGTCRLVRGETLALRQREFVQAARALGAPTGRVLFKEVLPNLTSIILVSITLAIPAYIGAEAGLSYLGVGLTLPTADWGLDISLAQDQMQAFPLPLLVPLIGLLIAVLCLSLLGDAISDAFNPNTRR